MLTYKQAGVDVTKNDRLVDMITDHTSVNPDFSTVRRIPGSETFLVQCTDGVGTKIKLAHYLLDPMELYATIGQDLVAMCYNDLVCSGAYGAFFQDYIGMNNLDEEIIKVLIGSIQRACQDCSMILTGGEMAEMPGTYTHDETPELVGFATGFTTLTTWLTKGRVATGNLIIGLPSSGPHSNGYSLINKLLETYPRAVEGIRDFIKPTILYHGVADFHMRQPQVINAIAHITGGGLINNLVRAIPEGLTVEINLDSWEIPDVFNFIQKVGNVDPDDMWDTFNMGVGMCLVISPDHLNIILNGLKSYKPFVIGKIVIGNE